MMLPDVNVLVNAYRADAPEHTAYARWVDTLVNGDSAFGMSDVVLSGFLRVVTHPRVFRSPSPIGGALEFASQIRDNPRCLPVVPGTRHWQVFSSLCAKVGARGNAIPDAYLAALAIESGSVFVTADRGFARFPALRWKHPLDH